MESQTLAFTLLSNHLINDGRYMAKIINQKTIGYENLLKEMENNTALRKDDIRLAITHFIDAIRGNLIRGLKVETPTGVIKTSIRGSFASLTEDFRPDVQTNNHEVRVIIKVSEELEHDVISELVTEKVLQNNPKHPKIITFINLNSPGNQSFQPTNLLSIGGINLKIDTDEDDEGVFWTDSQGEKNKNTSHKPQHQHPSEFSDTCTGDGNLHPVGGNQAR